MNVGGVCIGCTMPGFPDKFAPFYKAPPGSTLSATGAKLNGSFVRPLRRISQRDRNRETSWDKAGEVPSGWGHPAEPTVVDHLSNFFYKKIQYYKSQNLKKRAKELEEGKKP